MIARESVRRWIALGFAALSLVACSHAPSANDIPPGVDFSTKILADDSKLFVYSQRFMRGGPPTSDEMDYTTIDNPKVMRERDSMRAMLPKVSRKGLEATLAQNNYCRDGYMVLEQYEQHGSYIIRGECREAATSADREKFVRN